ncbi:MAG: hypothetical protein KDA31_13050 [Phycisphaerales bacterium]|nr:hypothetical protein [Phycisphaerales bacterium]
MNDVDSHESPHRDRVVALCELTNIRSAADADESRRLHAHAVAAIESTGLSPATHQRFLEYADAILGGHLGMLKRTQQSDAVFAQIRGERLWESYYHQRKSAAQLLRDAWMALHPPAPHPDGYTAKELMEQAGIQKTLWQRIRKEAEIQVPRGESGRKYRNGEVRRLVNAARSIGTKKAMQAVEAWERMLSEWESFAETA